MLTTGQSKTHVTWTMTLRGAQLTRAFHMITHHITVEPGAHLTIEAIRPIPLIVQDTSKAHQNSMVRAFYGIGKHWIRTNTKPTYWKNLINVNQLIATGVPARRLVSSHIIIFYIYIYRSFKRIKYAYDTTYLNCMTSITPVRPPSHCDWVVFYMPSNSRHGTHTFNCAPTEYLFVCSDGTRTSNPRFRTLRWLFSYWMSYLYRCTH